MTTDAIKDPDDTSLGSRGVWANEDSKSVSVTHHNSSRNTRREGSPPFRVARGVYDNIDHSLTNRCDTPSQSLGGTLFSPKRASTTSPSVARLPYSPASADATHFDGVKWSRPVPLHVPSNSGDFSRASPPRNEKLVQLSSVATERRSWTCNTHSSLDIPTLRREEGHGDDSLLGDACVFPHIPTGAKGRSTLTLPSKGGLGREEEPTGPKANRIGCPSAHETEIGSSPPQADRPVLADLRNDTQRELPFEIMQETFEVPHRCPDDLQPEQNRNWVPGKPLRIAYVSWNMGQREPRMNELSSFCIHPNAHIVVVSTQENGPHIGTRRFQSKWADVVSRKCLNSEYTLTAKEHMWAIQVLLFARTRDVATYISHAHWSHVPTGVCAGLGGNKGGVAVALALSMVPKASPDVSSTLVQTSTHGASSSSGLCNGRRLHTGEDDCASQDGGRSASGPHTHRSKEDVCHLTSPTPPPKTKDTDAFPSPKTRVANVDHDVSAAKLLTMLFINAHLTAHQGAVKNRNHDYHRIVKHLRVGTRGVFKTIFSQSAKRDAAQDKLLRKTGRHNAVIRISDSDQENMDASDSDSSSSGCSGASQLMEQADVATMRLPPVSKTELMRKPRACVRRRRRRRPPRDVTEEFDLTFFGGDLNYRINGTRQAIEYIIHNHRNLRSILINNDQLNLERAKRRVLHRFREGNLFFRPTYKYEVGIDSGTTLDRYNFSSKNNRMPAYCDRVLYKKRQGSAARGVTIRLYTDVPNVRTSDHRPVVAIFDVGTCAATE